MNRIKEGPVTLRIEGLKQIDLALKKVGIEFERKIARSAVRAGAKIIMEEAKRLAPVDPDGQQTLKKSIQVVTRSKRVGDAVVSVATRSGRKYAPKNMNAFYAPFLEFGTEHQPAQPFLRPALRKRTPSAIREMVKVIQRRLASLAKRKPKRRRR